jgi:hypothetical protein
MLHASSFVLASLRWDRSLKSFLYFCFECCFVALRDALAKMGLAACRKAELSARENINIETSLVHEFA